MAVVMEMHWQGIEPDQYEEVLNHVDWETNPADGGIFHAVWFEGGAMHIIDLWEDEAAFGRFTEERLGPVLAELGIDMSAANVTWHQAHRYFNTESAHARA